MAYKKPPTAGGAADGGMQSAGAKNFGFIVSTRSITAADRRVLAHRIGHLRQRRALGVAGLEAAAGRLIDRYPSCPRAASLLVDRIVAAMDRARLEGRA